MLALFVVALAGGVAPASAWDGFVNRGDALNTARYDFGTAGGSNENYYDGDFGDMDGDGVADRALISRYGLLWNSGDGIMVPVSTQLRNDMGPNTSESLTGYLFGDEVRIGNDAVQWVDLDGDGDLDVVQGGNGEPFVVQENRGARFAVTQRLDASAVDIVSIDLERDGDADLIAACWFPSGPDDFSVFVNDGRGNLTEQAAARGLALAGRQITGVAAGDVDADGDFDLVATSVVESALLVLRNDGRGNFAQTRLPFSGPFRRGGFSQGVNLGDIDGDGDLDLVLAHEDYTGTHMRVAHGIHLNDGRGGFVEESAARWDVGSASFVGRLVAGNGKLMDVDYDGDLDFYAFTELAGPPINFQLFLNDGTGRFLYTLGLVEPVGTPRTGSEGTGADADMSDLDRDGSWDVWVGIAGGRVTPLMNTYRDPTGLPADLPRDLRVESAGAGGIAVSWMPPPFASVARHYLVYRSVAPGVDERVRPVVHRVAFTVHEDEGFVAPIGPRTTTAQLGDPAVSLDGGRVTFTDRTATPGVRYFYSVAHVGPENIRSVPTAEVEARIDAATDGAPPDLAILSPSDQEWSRHPRVVLAFADDVSGVDPATLEVTLDVAAGPLAAGTNLADRASTRTDSLWVWTPALDEALPMGRVTLRAAIADRAGNRVERTVVFAPSIASPRPPTVTATATPGAGEAPLAVVLEGTGTDPDGEILRWEWELGDGATATGRRVRHVYAAEGMYAVRLVARDHQGGIAVATTTVGVAPCPGDCTPPDGGPVLPGRDGGGSVGDRDAGDIDRIPARVTDGGGCGCGTPGRGGSNGAGLLVLALLCFLGRRALKPGRDRGR